MGYARQKKLNGTIQSFENTRVPYVYPIDIPERRSVTHERTWWSVVAPHRYTWPKSGEYRIVKKEKPSANSVTLCNA